MHTFSPLHCLTRPPKEGDDAPSTSGPPGRRRRPYWQHLPVQRPPPPDGTALLRTIFSFSRKLELLEIQSLYYDSMCSARLAEACPPGGLAVALPRLTHLRLHMVVKPPAEALQSLGRQLPWLKLLDLGDQPGGVGGGRGGWGGGGWTREVVEGELRLGAVLQGLETEALPWCRVLHREDDGGRGDAWEDD